MTLKSTRDFLSQGGPVVNALHWCGNSDRFVFAKRCYKVGQKQIDLEGELEPSPLSQSAALTKHRATFLVMDNILATSLDGKYASSALGVYDLNTRKLIRQSPFPSLIPLFTNDGKGIYLVGQSKNLYFFPDWLNTFIPPDEKLK